MAFITLKSKSGQTDPKPSKKLRVLWSAKNEEASPERLERPVRVLHVIKTLGLGGAETNLFNLLEALSGKNVETHVAYSYGGEIEALFRKSSFRLFKYARSQHKLKSLGSFWIVARLVHYILKNRIDIVHTHNFNAHIWAGLAAKITGCKVVEHVHDFRYLDADEFRKRRGANTQFRFAKHFQKLSDRVIVLTKQNRDFLLENNFHDDEEVRIIQNGIPIVAAEAFDAAQKDRIKKEFRIGERDLVVSTSARIAPEKNIELIFDIVPEILEKIPNCVFLVSGDGPEYDSFRRKAQEPIYQNRLRMIGFRPDIREILSISDVFLLPSLLELHSISILEALSQGVPVMTSKGVGCNDEFIRSWETGVLLDPFSSRGWARAVIRLLSDNDLRRSIGEDGRMVCRDRFDIKKIALRIEGLYAELVRG